MRSILPITDAVQAALWYANPIKLTMDQREFACHKMIDEATDEDREQVCLQLAAAARILADEVERLRKEQQPQTITLSDCCQAPAVVAGKPNSTQWYACPECCQPCDVYYQDKNTQPL